MKPNNWNKLSAREKRRISWLLLNSERGNYLISQALVLAIKDLKKVPKPRREVSNIQDMEVLLELFPIYAIIDNMRILR